PPRRKGAPMRGDRPTVDPAARATLRRMIEQEAGRVSRRAQAVVWWLGGQSQTAVSRRLGVARQSVQAWCARFRAEGPPGLRDRPRPGRPATAGAAGVAAVADCLSGSDRPGTTGPGAWTIPRLVAALAERGLAVGGRTVRRLLRQLEARWRRGRLVAKGDPDRLGVLERLAADLLTAHLAAQRAGRRLVVVFEDEADLALLAHA